MPTRDYSLLGADGRRAVETGLAAAEWYHTDVPRKVMKDLMQRTDGPALRDTAIYYGLMVALVVIGIAWWPSWWTLPVWLAYGVLYGSASDSRWHECGHGTAFRTPWMNNVVYQVACFMIVRNPTGWRWSHARHHTDTIIVGRDPEIALMRPPSLIKAALAYVGVLSAWDGWKRMALNATGRLDAEEATYIPDSEKPKVILVARIWTAIYAATILTALATWSILPLMVIGLPRLYGCWHHVMVGLIQHGGLADNVTDHRLNSRTVYMNPINRFIYWNMNYHVEHHMFPMVPYHALPRLHALIKDDLPAPCPSVWAAYREMIPALLRQQKEPDYYIRKVLPPTAKPFRDEFHQDVPGAMPAE
jgi:fatty acid desaturase